MIAEISNNDTVADHYPSGNVEEICDLFERRRIFLSSCEIELQESAYSKGVPPIYGLYSPIKFKSTDGNFYGISGSTWVKIDPSVTKEELVSMWVPHKILKGFYQDKKEISRHELTIKSSSSGNNYKVVVDGDYNRCSCIGFTFHKKCKHVKEARNRLKATGLIK